MTATIEQIGTPLELYDRPANRFVAGFIGSPRMNFIRRQGGRRSRAAPSPSQRPASRRWRSKSRPAPPCRAGDTVTVGIRPEGFSDSGEWTIPARVAVIESLGRETLLYADAGALRAYDSESQEGFFAVHRSAQIVAAPDDPDPSRFPATPSTCSIATATLCAIPLPGTPHIQRH